MKPNQKQTRSLIAMLTLISFVVSCQKGKPLQIVSSNDSTQKIEDKPKVPEEGGDSKSGGQTDTGGTEDAQTQEVTRTVEGEKVRYAFSTPISQGEISKEPPNDEKINGMVEKVHGMVSERLKLMVQMEAGATYKNGSEFLCLFGSSTEIEMNEALDVVRGDNSAELQIKTLEESLNQNLESIKKQSEELKDATSLTVRSETLFMKKTTLKGVCNRKGEILQAAFDIQAEINSHVFAVEAHNKDDLNFHKDAMMLMGGLAKEVVITLRSDISLPEGISSAEDVEEMIFQTIQSNTDLLNYDPLVL